MDARQLESLRAVRAQEGVTAAAAVLHLTPSAVSQQLAALQRDVGVPLTRQVGRRLRLTPAGEALADAAVDVAVALERARSACAVYLDRPTGTVELSAFQSGAELLLPDLLTRVAGLGGIEVRCTEADVALQGGQLLRHRGRRQVQHRGRGRDPLLRPDGAQRLELSGIHAARLQRRCRNLRWCCTVSPFRLAACPPVTAPSPCWSPSCGD